MDDYLELLRKYVADWHKLAQLIKKTEQIAAEEPAMVAEFYMDTIRTHYRENQRRLRDRFGLEGWMPDHVKIICPERVPEDLFDLIESGLKEEVFESMEGATEPVSTECVRCLHALIAATALVRIALSIHWARKRAERRHEDPDRAACDELFQIARTWLPAYFGALAAANVPSSLRQTAAARLASWVASKISLSRNRRLEAVLVNESDGTAFDKLLEELPTATYIEWVDGEVAGLHTLVSRVARRLVREGNETTRLERQGKLLDLEAAVAVHRSSDEEALEEFLILEQLGATLARRESEVLELILHAHTEREIATELQITEGSVKQLKSRARAKLKQAV